MRKMLTLDTTTLMFGLRQFAFATLPLFLAVFATAACQAQLQSGMLGTPARADQSVRVFDDALGQGIPGFEDTFTGFGNFEFSWADENNGTAEITGFSATFSGFNSNVGAFDLFAGGPGNVTPTGSLANIQESGGMLVDADFTINTAFAIELGNGATIYTQEAATFVGRLSGGFFTSPDLNNDDIDGYLVNPNGADPIVAVSSGRTVTAIPEPASATALMLFCGLGLITRRRYV